MRIYAYIRTNYLLVICDKLLEKCVGDLETRINLGHKLPPGRNIAHFNVLHE